MELRRFTDPAAFREFVDPLLLRSEARHNLILGVSGILIDRPEVYPEFHLWAIEDYGDPVAAAVRTPPHNVILADAVSSEAAQLLASTVSDGENEVPGAVGNEPTVGTFVESWGRISGKKPVRSMAQGVYALSSVRSVPAVPGSSRVATGDDRAFLIDWISDFSREAVGEDDTSLVPHSVDLRLSAGPDLAGYWIWEDRGEPVSLSGYGGRTPNGIRIGPVYTPPEHRRLGYATALVAEQSQWLLSQGRHFCFLYTDLANPTSNSIYQRIGYEQVAESAEYSFRS